MMKKKEMNGLTVGAIRKLSQKRQPKKRQKVTGKRYVEFRPDTAYVCVRKGKDFTNEEEIETIYKNGDLKESLFYIFKHTDPNMERNVDVPLFEAVYKIGAHYKKTQKCQLKQAYINDDRTNYEKMWITLDDGSPYWVDRYAYSKEKQKRN